MQFRPAPSPPRFGAFGAALWTDHTSLMSHFVVILYVFILRVGVEPFVPGSLAISPTAASVVFVASGASILGVRTIKIDNVEDLRSDATGGGLGGPSDGEVVITVPTSGDARCLHASGPFMFWCDSNGIACVDVRGMGASSPMKVSKLAQTNKALGAAFRGKHKFTDVTGVCAVPLATDGTPLGMLQNYLLVVVCGGSVYAVEADSVHSLAGLVCVDLGPVPHPSACAYRRDERSVVFLGPSGAHVWQFGVDVNALLAALQTSKAAVVTPGAPKGKPSGKSSASKPPAGVAPTPTLRVDACLVCEWPGGTIGGQEHFSLAADTTGHVVLALRSCEGGSGVFAVQSARAGGAEEKDAYPQTPAVLRDALSSVTPITTSAASPVHGGAAHEFLGVRVRPSNNNFIETLFAAAAAREEVRYLQVESGRAACACVRVCVIRWFRRLNCTSPSPRCKPSR